jgi:hypothetical protein
MKNLYVKSGDSYKLLEEPEVSDTLFIRVGNKYIPHSVNCSNLSEGVWVITSRPGVRSIASGSYLNDVFEIRKCCNIEPLTLKELGSLESLYQEVCADIDDFSGSPSELIYKVISIIYHKYGVR